MSPDNALPANDTPLSPLSFLERSARVFPDRLAVIHGDRQLTYREFGHRVEQFARAIRTRIRPGDRVAFLSPNTPELLFAHYAVPLAGGVLVALNSRLAGRELEYILDHSGAVLLFVDAELSSVVDGFGSSVASLDSVVRVVDPTVPDDHAGTRGTEDFADFLSAAADDTAPIHWGVDDENQPISINYTSGTTGNPKGVLYSHRGAYLNSLGETFHNGFDGHTRYLWTLPMFHCNGWCTTWAVTQAAGTHVCLRAVRGADIWKAIDDLGITHLCGAPAVCSTIAQAPGAHRVDELRITTAGAPPSPTVIGQLEALGFTIVHVYGLTEVYGPYTICEHQDSWSDLPADQRAALLARQGVGMVQAETARVVDEDMVDVPADGKTMGEIVLRGNNVMIGYFRDPEATAAAFAGGWFHTGDLGVMHADGYIQLKDRAKDIVISGGENISTVEIEQVLVSHEEVLDVAVIGVPDEKWGERPKAFVIVAPSATVTADELRDHVRRHLARFKVPDDIVFIDELPRTSTGKIVKYALREQN